MLKTRAAHQISNVLETPPPETDAHDISKSDKDDLSQLLHVIDKEILEIPIHKQIPGPSPTPIRMRVPMSGPTPVETGDTHDNGH